jgi:hypothetical protein
MEKIKNVDYGQLNKGFEAFCNTFENKIIVDDQYSKEVWVYEDSSITDHPELEDRYECLEYMIQQLSWEKGEYDIDIWHDTELNNWICTVTPILAE